MKVNITTKKYLCPLRVAWYLALFFCLVQFSRAEVIVTFTGNHFYRNTQLLELLSPDPETYTPEGLHTWEDDAHLYINDLYRKNGFFDVEITLKLQPTKDKPKDWDAAININEGERYHFDKVQVSERDSLKVKSGTPSTNLSVNIDLQDLKVKTGNIYFDEKIFQDRRFLIREYGNAGFIRAKVYYKTTLKPETHAIKVDYFVEPAYPIVFDTLYVRNLRASPDDNLKGLTKNSLLASLFPYHRGDTVRIAQNDRLIEKLQYAGTFNYVRIKDSLLPGPEHHSAIYLFAEEHTPGNIHSSAFYETQYGPGVSLDLRHSNVAGTLKELRGGSSVAVDKQNSYLGFGSPLTLGLLVRFDEDLDFNWLQDQPVHKKEGLWGGDFEATNSMRLTWPWSYWLRLVTNAELKSQSRMLSESDRERSLDLNFIQTSFFTFVNQSLDPTRGLRYALSWGNGGHFIENSQFYLSKHRHNWLELQSSYYYYFHSLPQIKFAMRLNGGRFFGEGETNSDRFYLGGGRNVRSYAYQALCPDTLLVPSPNDSTQNVTVCSDKNLTAAYFLSSYELRFAPFDFRYIRALGPLRFLKPLEIVPFYDFGKVWNVEKGFSWSSQQHGQGYAYGWGLRYPLLGVFNLRFDLAYGAPGNGYWPDQWVVDLAQAF